MFETQGPPLVGAQREKQKRPSGVAFPAQRDRFWRPLAAPSEAPGALRGDASRIRGLGGELLTCARGVPWIEARGQGEKAVGPLEELV